MKKNSLKELFVFQPESLKILTANRALCTKLGYSFSLLKTMTPLDFLPKEEAEIFLRNLSELLEKKKEQINYSTIFCCENGKCYDIFLNMQLLNIKGKILYIAAGHGLSNTHTCFDLFYDDVIVNGILNRVQDAVVVFDGYGKVIFWNAYAGDIFGYAEEEVIGRSLCKIVISYDNLCNNFIDYFNELLATNDTRNFIKRTDLLLKHKNGNDMKISMSLSPVKLLNNWCVIGILHDITKICYFE